MMGETEREKEEQKGQKKEPKRRTMFQQTNVYDFNGIPTSMLQTWYN